VRVVWTPEAENDRNNIWEYIASEDPRAALRIDQLFSDWVTKLEEHPKIGKAGQIPGTIPIAKTSRAVQSNRVYLSRQTPRHELAWLARQIKANCF
jgi:plasmid stabilization system protein ParE